MLYVANKAVIYCFVIVSHVEIEIDVGVKSQDHLTPLMSVPDEHMSSAFRQRGSFAGCRSLS